MQVRLAPKRSSWVVWTFVTLGITGLIAGGCGGADDASIANPETDSGVAPAPAPAQCAAPSTMCGTSCVDTKNDPANCGACGTACVAGQVCSNGACSLACAGGATKCGEACVDSKVDPSNCGTCGNKCGPGLVCSAGQCGLTCSGNLVRCEGADAGVSQAVCANVKNDNANCGGCGNTCSGAQRCIDGACAVGCATTLDCPSTAAKCSSNRCVAPLDCAEIKQQNPSAPSGRYTIDPDGTGGVAPFPVWCDMVTDGGGWTIVFAHSGLDNEAGLVSNTEVDDKPLDFRHTNLNRAKKMALSALETESIFVRKDGRWLKANKPLFNDKLDTANTDASVAVKLNGMNGAVADARMGWSNHDITGGGDFGISMSPDAATCGGTTVDGFDHHSTSYLQLNCSCQRQYLYSYSNATQDSDAAYNVNTGLGGWTATAGCTSAEGSGFAFYAAMRRPLAAYQSCSAMKTAEPNALSGWYLIDPDGSGPNAPVGAYCEMTADGGGYTLVPVTGGISTKRYDEANSCANVGLSTAVARTKTHLQSMDARFGTSYVQTVPGVYGLAAGVYTGCAMNSTDATCAANWKALDGNAWFARSIAYGEPNGDYVAGCWLGVTGRDGNGVTFNDGNCGYFTGANYLCSDNLK